MSTLNCYQYKFRAFGTFSYYLEASQTEDISLTRPSQMGILVLLFNRRALVMADLLGFLLLLVPPCGDVAIRGKIWKMEEGSCARVTVARGPDGRGKFLPRSPFSGSCLFLYNFLFLLASIFSILRQGEMCKLPSAIDSYASCRFYSELQWKRMPDLMDKESITSTKRLRASFLSQTSKRAR